MTWDGQAFSRRLRTALASAGMERKELAAQTRLSYPQVQRLTSRVGRPTPPSQPELDAIARAVGRTTDWLLTTDGDVATPRDEQEERLADRLDQMEQRVERAVEIAEGLEQRLREAGMLPAP